MCATPVTIGVVVDPIACPVLPGAGDAPEPPDVATEFVGPVPVPDDVPISAAATSGDTVGADDTTVIAVTGFVVPAGVVGIPGAPTTTTCFSVGVTGAATTECVTGSGGACGLVLTTTTSGGLVFWIVTRPSIGSLGLFVGAGVSVNRP
jgi:hypothetical protein